MFARTDWEYVFNTFAFGYAIGYHFVASPQGSCNGNFLGIGMNCYCLAMIIELTLLTVIVFLLGADMMV